MPLGLAHRLAGEQVGQRRGHLADHVADLADPPVPHPAARGRRVGFEIPGVRHHQPQAAPRRLRLHPPRIGRPRRRRLLDQHVAAGRQRHHRMLGMQRVRRGDDHAVRPRLRQQRRRVLVAGRNGEILAQPPQLCFAQPADADAGRCGMRLQHRKMVQRRPPAGANDGDACGHSAVPPPSSR
jgi:hypothetical protein